ncbi:MAG: ACT domain-containing protein, partial [Candidatus Bipolaricaulota bacterium]
VIAMIEFRLRVRDRPGALVKVAEALAGEGINLLAIAGLVAGRSGANRIVTDDPARARSVLECLRIRFEEKEALVVRVADVPGELASILRELENHLINVESVYPTSAGGQLILTVDNTEKARPLLPLA